MTVPATARRAGPFNGNGVTTSFPFTFKVFAASDIEVVLADSDGLETELVLGSGYSVTLNPDQDASPGGAVIYPLVGTPLPAGSTLTVRGAIPYDQTLDLPSGGAFSPRALENALDRTVIQVQQLAEETARGLKLPVSSTADPVLPAPESNKVIGWNDSASGLVNRDITDLASAIAYGTNTTQFFGGNGTATQFTLAADPGSVHNLDVSISGVVQSAVKDFTLSGLVLTFLSAPPAGTNNIAVRYGQALPVGTADSADVTFLPAGAGATTRSVQSKLREAVSVLDFGAVGDGVADDAAAIQAALSASYGKRLRVPKGHYKCNSPLVLTEGLWIDMDPEAILDFSDMPAGTALGQRIAITANGAGRGADESVTSEIYRGDYVVVMSTTSRLTAGDWIIVRSDQQYSDGAASGIQTRGHMTRVKAVNSGTQITLHEGSPFRYSVASNTRVSRCALIEGVKITGGQILLGGVGSVHTGIRVNYGLAPTIEGVKIVGGEDAGVSFGNCIAPAVINAQVLDSTSPGGAIGNTGYGVAVYGGCGGRIVSSTMTNCRHGVAGGGSGLTVSIGATVSNNELFGCGINTWALDCHEPCFEWKFIGNTVHGGNGGAIIRGPGALFHGNTILNVLTSAIQIQQFVDNTDGVADTVVSSNRISNPGGGGIWAIGHTITTDKITGLTISDNSITGAGSHAIYATHCVGLQIRGGTVRGQGGSGKHGVYLNNVTGAAIAGGRYDLSATTNAAPVFAEACTGVSITDATLLGSAGATNQDGVRVSGTTNLRVRGNTISGNSRHGVYTSATDRVIIAHNDVRNAGATPKILVEGATTQIVQDNID